jgi:aspartyl-tRNA(Asn)/glutamyl-tRNA(Gln) amidotransferase subunit A
MGHLIPATQYVQVQRYRSELRSHLLAHLELVDALATPTTAFVAPQIGATDVDLGEGQIESVVPGILRFTEFASLSGLPALSVPCGFSSSGLPIGLQLVGRPFSDFKLLSIGHTLQLATTWHTERAEPTGANHLRLVP